MRRLLVSPACGVAWTTPPPPYTVDEVVAIEEAAPNGLRLPNEAEIQGVLSAGVALVEVHLEDWLDDLAEHLTP